MLYTNLRFFSIFQCKDKIQICLVILKEQKYFDSIEDFSSNGEMLRQSIQMHSNTVMQAHFL